MAAEGLSEATGSVHAAAVDDQRREEERIAGLHLHVDALLRQLGILNAVVELVDAALPVGVVMLQVLHFVAARHHHQAAVLSVGRLQGHPTADDLLHRTNGKVVDLLVQRVTTGARVNGRLVDEHAEGGNIIKF